ncbi:hypothetical protein AB0N29_17695 [Nocardioides sp. NPDC092400]|uniref:5-methylcytosine restriction system specificity protein McrC n=1 Tax=Nocardioides sp. NPDC092400 TaxID=3155196 RepID=UPI00342C1D54
MRAALSDLTTTLKPRLRFLGATGEQVIIRNLAGSLQVNSQLVLDVAPKVPVGTDWAGALVDLLTAQTRAQYGGIHHKAERRHARVLPDAFADLYATQLDRAIRREGPLTLIRAHDLTASSLTGRLDVTKWVTSRPLQPAQFPQHRTNLTVDNEFTNAMAWVAQTLASRTSDPRTSSRLVRLATRLRPGMPTHTRLAPGVALRDIPAQWREYRPAWETARAVIRKITPLHRDGSLQGIGLAVEPWPLLETLLAITLEQVAALASAEGVVGITGYGHAGNFIVRKPIGRRADRGDISLQRLAKPGWVNPDGVLKRGSEVLVSFEAKYVKPNAADLRKHTFQALTTAAVTGARRAVIVYPEAGPTLSWAVNGFGDTPSTLHVVGLDMFTYRHGDESRAQTVYQLVRDTLKAPPSATPPA